MRQKTRQKMNSRWLARFVIICFTGACLWRECILLLLHYFSPYIPPENIKNQRISNLFWIHYFWQFNFTPLLLKAIVFSAEIIVDSINKLNEYYRSTNMKIASLLQSFPSSQHNISHYQTNSSLNTFSFVLTWFAPRLLLHSVYLPP